MSVLVITSTIRVHKRDASCVEGTLSDYEARILSKSRYEPRLRATPRKRVAHEPRALSSVRRTCLSAFLRHAVVVVVDLAGWQVFIESHIEVALISIVHGAQPMARALRRVGGAYTWERPLDLDDQC